MSGLAQNIGDYSADMIVRRRAAMLWFRACQLMKALLVVVLLFSGAPVATSHAQSHFATGGQAQIALISHGDAQDDSKGRSTLFDGLEHHACNSPCLEPLPTRSHYVSAFFDGSQVKYPAYLDAVGNSIEPDPLHKPPRLTLRA